MRRGWEYWGCSAWIREGSGESYPWVQNSDGRGKKGRSQTLSGAQQQDKRLKVLIEINWKCHVRVRVRNNSWCGHEETLSQVVQGGCRLYILGHIQNATKYVTRRSALTEPVELDKLQRCLPLPPILRVNNSINYIIFWVLSVKILIKASSFHSKIPNIVLAIKLHWFPWMKKKTLGNARGKLSISGRK